MSEDRMSRDEALRKLLKLRQMRIAGTEHERVNARNLMEKIMVKYGLKDADIVETKEFPFKMNSENRRWLAHIAVALGIKLIVISYKNSRKHSYRVTATAIEFEVFKKAVSGFEIEKKQQLRKLKISMNSYLDGWALATFPIPESKEPKCPKCGYEISKYDGRWTCMNMGCGWKGSKERERKYDRDSYMDGIKNSGRLLATER